MNDEPNQNPAAPEEAQPLQKPDVPPVTEEYAPLPDAVGTTSRRSAKIRLLLIVLGILLLLAGLLFYNAQFNFYDRTMRHLGFDYRNGESIGASLGTDTSVAIPIANRVQNSTLSLHAVHYVLIDAATTDRTVTVLDYTHAADHNAIALRSGVEDWIFTKSESIRETSDGCEVKSGFHWEQTTELQVPDYATLFFAAADTAHHKVKLYDCYPACVNEKQYTCEIWLIEQKDVEQPVYFTVYRYYSGDILAAVRILNSNASTMSVFDITDYTLE